MAKTNGKLPDRQRQTGFRLPESLYQKLIRHCGEISQEEGKNIRLGETIRRLLSSHPDIVAMSEVSEEK